jgi:16S rRNA C1402 (ribose-2'-O) methylase RsmI
VPGHISNPLDITVRAIQVLQEAACIFLEAGKIHAATALLESVGVPVRGKTLVELSNQPDLKQRRKVRAAIQRAIRLGANLCLFGVDEGIPGFQDPGKAIFREAARCGEQLRIESLGGPSALSTALMRSDTEINRFSFIGFLDKPEACRWLFKVLERAEALDQALVFYTSGEALERCWPELWDRCARRSCRIQLFCDLTLPSEEHLTWAPRQGAPPAPPRFAKDIKLIAMVWRRHR